MNGSPGTSILREVMIRPTTKRTMRRLQLLLLLMLPLVPLSVAWAAPVPSVACPPTPPMPVPTIEGDAEVIAHALCELAEGRAELAAHALAQRVAGAHTEPLDAYARLVAAEARLELGEAAAALELLAGDLDLPDDSPAAHRAALLRGTALMETGEYAEGRRVLVELLSGKLGGAGYRPDPWGADPGEVRYQLLRGAVFRGDADAAADVWIRIWTHNPDSPRAAEVEANLAGIGVVLADPQTPVGRARLIERADTLAKMHRHGEALELLDSLPQLSTVEWTGRMAVATFRARDYARSVRLHAQLSEPTAQQTFDHALAASRTGDYAAAAEIYARLLEGVPDGSRPSHELVDQASYKLGYLAYDAGDLARGIELFRAHLARFPSTRHGDEARWFIGWSLYRRSRFEEALVAFADLVERHPKSSLAAGGRYWGARTAGAMGDADAENTGLEQVLEQHPGTSYAWFASQRLGRSWKALPEPTTEPATIDEPAFVRGIALAGIGLGSWARAELQTLVPAAKKAGRDEALGLASALSHAGAWRLARDVALPHCGAPEDQDGDPLAMRLCWPRPHGEANSAAAVAGGLPAHLPYAIMKAESGWKPWVTSPAGARGIMQMMPALGQELHDRLKLPGSYDPGRLYEAEYNSRLAIEELASLQRRLGTSGVDPVLPLVIAGYNGGAEAVTRWVGLYESTPNADRFAEDIGYSETRRYVRRVLGTLQTYRYVYGDGWDPPGAGE